MTLPITIAMPTYNPEEGVFRRVVAAALAGSPREVRLVVVDMSDTDVVRRVCADAEDQDRIDYEALPDSRGVSHSRNRCVEVATSRFIAFLDSDAYAEPRWLEPLVAQLAGDQDVAVVGSRVLPAWRDRNPSRMMRTATAGDWLSLLDLGDEPISVPAIMGTSYAIDRERVPDPPFDESRGRRPGVPTAGEEVLLCQRAWAAGHRVMYEPRSLVHHDIPRSRATWRWMWRRAYAAGQERSMWDTANELPRRRFRLADHAFRAIVAGPFLVGQLRARVRTPR